jgi:hypothetical protein
MPPGSPLIQTLGFTQPYRGIMKTVRLALAICLMHQNLAMAASASEVRDWLDLYVDSCVGSGSKDVVSGSVGAGGEISLRKVTLTGQLSGDVRLTKESYRLLSEGISNKLTGVAADQADKVRQCLDPMRKVLLRIASRQLQGGSAGEPIAYILSPQEELVLKIVATTPGMEMVGSRRIGFHVTIGDVERQSSFSDLRLRVLTRLLAEKKLLSLSGIVGPVTHASLTPAGEQYAVEMGYAK